MAYPFLFTTLLLAGTVPPAPVPSSSPAIPARLARDRPACRPLGLAPGVVPATSVLAARANMLQADIGNARRARTLTPEQADSLWHQADQVRQRVAGKARLPVTVRGEANRALESVAAQLCRG
ncbi:hypothetical protein KZ813_08860 [Sphingomonas sp. RHCKR7]|uniref:hypothetical protein n=1 Tax=Sphingomonas folli TaxID=2862497 RepID=UPI001CA4BB8B|nr:hypothetical protein [Sphingomonas folli]MBW6526944.1 hypothetical protein [Sphingomonas folli]